ncbi:hypothetical protein BAE44_0024758, partial [Dichanthelium oligosanthes]
LLMALLATVISADRGSSLSVEAKRKSCSKVGACSDSLCTEKCGKHSVVLIERSMKRRR